MKNLTLLLILIVPVFTFSQIIHIPDNYPAIQLGIDTAKIEYKPKTIGAAVGSAKINIPINGNQGTYEQNRKMLKRYSDK
ncbi:MAG: hypothetical protein ISS17_00560 [Bacteroidales bacterium]|nr:hypothetical protein [Bacteroidales bacterium]